MANISDLTPRELENLSFVVEGKTNKAIACEIHISLKTVGFHLDRIYTKIGVRTRLMAGGWAIQHGLQWKLGESLAGLRRRMLLQLCWK